MSADRGDYLPGTSRLVEEESSSHSLMNGKIILTPPPTSSPNDPLNWPFARKVLHCILVCFVTGFTAATANDAASAQTGMNEDLGISYNTMNTGAGVLFIGIGYFTLLISPAAWLYGRRITYLVCITLGLVGAIWMARVQGSEDSIWNQLFVGASESCAEANVQLSLSDLFFEHQRGTVLGIYVLATSIGTFLGPLIGSYIADLQGWRWVGWWAVIISGATLIVLFFGLEETSFDRPSYRTRDGLSGYQTPDGAEPAEKAVNDTKTATGDDTGEVNEAALAAQSIANETGITTEAPKSYLQRIKLITPAPNLIGTGFKQYITRLVHTLKVFGFPAVIYSGIQWGAQDAWLTFYLTVEDTTWYDPPWNYGDAGVGIMNVPCIIGAVIGCFWGGYISDLFVVWKARRRGGIREAEDRLWIMFPVALFSPLGMLLFGIGSNDGWSWPVPYVGLAFIGFGWGCAGDLSMAYLMDAYPEMVLEGMVGVSVVNNTLGCIFTFTASDWLAASGNQNTFIAIAVLDFFFVMLTVPMMIWGKSCRQWTKQRYLNFVRTRDSL